MDSNAARHAYLLVLLITLVCSALACAAPQSTASASPPLMSAAPGRDDDGPSVQAVEPGAGSLVRGSSAPARSGRGDDTEIRVLSGPSGSVTPWRGEVEVSAGGCVTVRPRPSLSSDASGCIHGGDRAVIVKGPIHQDEKIWWLVRARSAIGYVDEDDLPAVGN